MLGTADTPKKFIEAADNFKGTTQELFALTVGDPEWVKRNITSQRGQFIAAVAERLPEAEYERALFEHTFGHAEWAMAYEDLLPNTLFLNLRPALFNFTVRNGAWVLKNLNTLQKFCRAAEIFAEMKSAFFYHTVGNAEWFKKNVTTNQVFAVLKEIFPDNVMVQSAKTIEDLNEKLAIWRRDKSILSQASATLFQSFRQHESFFGLLPCEINIQIAQLSSASNVLTSFEKKHVVEETYRAMKF